MRRPKWQLAAFAALAAALLSTTVSAAPGSTPARTTTPRSHTCSPTTKSNSTHTTTTSANGSGFGNTNGSGQGHTPTHTHTSGYSNATPNPGWSTPSTANGYTNKTGTTSGYTNATPNPAWSTSSTTNGKTNGYTNTTGFGTMIGGYASTAGFGTTAGLGSPFGSVTGNAYTGSTTRGNAQRTTNPNLNGLANSISSANTTGVLTALHQAHKLLATADHDYEGHRAKAAHYVTQAIHEVGGHHQGANKGATGNGGNANNGQPGKANVNNAQANNGNANRLPQAQSDAQLQQAIRLLNGLQGKVPNHPKAAVHIQAAIAELNTALKIN